MTKYIPAGFRVLVKLKKVNEAKEIKSAGGIVMEIKENKKINAEKRATQKAYVIAVGKTAWKGYDDGHPWAKVGDCVLICKYSGDDLDDVEEDQIYRIISDRDIEAVVHEEEEVRI